MSDEDRDRLRLVWFVVRLVARFVWSSVTTRPDPLRDPEFRQWAVAACRDRG